jgi:soluble lytic murein transglycosylase-like protein
VFTRRTTRKLAASFLTVLAGLVLFTVSACIVAAHAQPIPQQAQRHRLTLKREAQHAWGLGAPVATFAAQIHQESRWRDNARSPVGAEGLAQFMPATANWIGGLYASLGERAPNNPTWAIRALVTYDKWLADRLQAESFCEEMAFVLSAYNGGLGWVQKRQRASRRPGVCMDVACAINPGVSAASQRENEHYPKVILRTYEPLYATWGPGACS